MVALPLLLLVSLNFAYPSGGREFHQEVVTAGYDPSSLREGLSKTALKAEGWSITRKSAITQDYLGYSPKVIRSEITPRGMTESPVKP